MKKYKHKITGNTAVETHSEKNYRVQVPQNFTIPKWIVESSTDWEEIIELCVPIGTRFTSKVCNELLILKKQCSNNGILIHRLGTFEIYHDMLSIEQVNQFFKEGIWKIYEEKEYEILSFINYKNIFSIPANTILTRIKDTKSFNFQNIYDNEISILENNKWSIHSVKRLSDGEIFTVGDRIKSINIGERIIEEFFLDENCIYINKGTYCKYVTTLKYANKLIPIFTTEDGVNIYEGDEYYYTDEEITLDSKIYYNAKTSTHVILLNGVIRFSTKEKCQEYIDKQKILFVTKDKVSKKTNDFCFQLCKKSGIRVQIKVDLKFYDPDNYYYIDNIDLAFAIGYAILCKNNLVNLHSHALIEANNKINNLLNERK